MTALFSFVRPVSADVIAIFYALDQDRDTFLKNLPDVQKGLAGNHPYFRVKLGPHEVYGIKMGRGPVETAISAEALLGKIASVDLAISLGPAGSLQSSLQPWTWVVINGVLAYQSGSYGSGGFQMNTTPIKISLGDPNRGTLPKPWIGLDKFSIASGEAFCGSDSFREKLRTETGTSVVDMNLFGLQKVLNDLHLESIHWRIISDQAGDQAGAQFGKFIKTYDGSGGEFLKEWLTTLKPNPAAAKNYPEIEKLITNP